SSAVPHTVRGTETKRCTDCHISERNDNNAKMAQLLMQGTDFVNFIGRFCWIGEGHDGMQAVAVTERDEPQAVFGSHLYQLAYPDEYKIFLAHQRELRESYEHAASLTASWVNGRPEWRGEVTSIQNRGEYLFTAQGPAGMVVYDIAHLDDK